MFRNIIQSLFTKGLVAVINFFILIVSSRYLGVGSRGEIGILILNISIIQIINEIFTGYTLVYFIPRFNLRKIYIAGIVYTLLACSLSNAVFYFIKKFIPGYEFLSFGISLLVILNTFNCVIILGKEKIQMYNFLNLVQPLILLLGLMFAAGVLKIYTFDAYVWPLLISFVLAFVISSMAVLRLLLKNRGDQPFEMAPILTNGLLCQMAVLMHVFCNRYSYYLLGNNIEVGLYSSASSLIESVLIISNGIAPVLLSKVANAGDSEKSQKITLSLAKASFILSVICVAIIGLLPNDLFVFILGKGFADVKYIMMLYSPGILMLSFAGIISHYFSATGKLRTILLCNTLGFIFAITLSHLLIGKYRLSGAAVAADVSYTVLTLSLCVAFFTLNRLKFKQLFTFKSDYNNLKELFFSGRNNT